MKYTLDPGYNCSQDESRHLGASNNQWLLVQPVTWVNICRMWCNLWTAAGLASKSPDQVDFIAGFQCQYHAVHISHCCLQPLVRHLSASLIVPLSACLLGCSCRAAIYSQVSGHKPVLVTVGTAMSGMAGKNLPLRGRCELAVSLEISWQPVYTAVGHCLQCLTSCIGLHGQTVMIIIFSCSMHVRSQTYRLARHPSRQSKARLFSCASTFNVLWTETKLMLVSKPMLMLEIWTQLSKQKSVITYIIGDQNTAHWLTSELHTVTFIL